MTLSMTFPTPQGAEKASPAAIARDRARARLLNRDCACITLDRPTLLRALARETAEPDVIETLAQTRPYLVSDKPVFIARADLEAMRSIVSGIERVVHLPAFKEAALARAPKIAAIDHGPAGVFMGYDFHIAEDGPRLIEINTNAGGAFINALVARAQIGCCPETLGAFEFAGGEDFGAEAIAMFANEHARQKPGAPLSRVAIVDDAPTEQYLFPEFLLARQLFARYGVEAVIADASLLTFQNGRLLVDGAAADLVYNRLTDFALEAPAHDALRRAYEAGAVVLTPNPRTHALYADKRNLVALSDQAALRTMGASETDLAALKTLPRAIEVTAENAGALWADRKSWFFKPFGGYGARAVYRGDKLTKRVWNAIVSGGYVAQEFASPGESTIAAKGGMQTAKHDIRLYTYEGNVVMAAARVYQGQTTNFRTPGGGFAPVFIA